EMLYLPAGLYMLRNQDSSLWPPLVWGHMPSKPMPEDAWYWRWVTASMTLTWGLKTPPSRIIPAIASYWFEVLPAWYSKGKLRPILPAALTSFLASAGLNWKFFAPSPSSDCFFCGSIQLG